MDEAVIAGFLTDIKRILEVQADKTPVMLSDAPANVAAGELEACRAVLHGFWSVWEPNGAVAARYGVAVDPQADERITSLPLPEVRECYALLPGQAQGVYFARSVIGVNANSDQQELAMEFLRCMLSAEVQDNDLSDGFPVRRSSWMYNLQKTNRSTVEIPMDEGAFVYAQPAGYVYEDLLQRFETLQTPVENDAELYSEVETQMERLLAGDTGAEEAAEVIASKINLRLTEAG